MNMNILFMIAELPTPLIYMIIGFAMWKNPPSYKVNAGYKTELSRSSEQAWLYAQTFYGKLSGIVFAVISAVTLAFNIFALVTKLDDTKGLIAFLVWISVVFAALAIVKGTVERRLKAAFGKGGDGNER
ncbi:MAG: SdpI family protein [Oscillospiraceae bacterium]|nr:SdpI family protein [Oscillospiraceae bacterium]